MKTITLLSSLFFMCPMIFGQLEQDMKLTVNYPGYKDDNNKSRYEKVVTPYDIHFDKNIDKSGDNSTILSDDFEDGDYANDPTWIDVSENTGSLSVEEVNGDDQFHTYELKRNSNIYTAYEDGEEMCSGKYINNSQWHDNISKIKIAGRGSWSGSGVYYDDIEMKKTFSGEDQTLIAYYPFNGNVNDESGNGNDGTPHGGLGYTTDKDGNANGAVSLDGEDDKIVLPNLELDFPWSISFWVKPDLDNFTSYKFYESDSWDAYWGTYYGFTVSIHETGKISAHFGDGSGGAANSAKGFHTETSPLRDDQWSFITIVFEDYNNVNIYHNGNPMVLEMGGNIDLNSISFQNTKDEIGADDYDTGERYWKGEIDEMRIYNKVLSEQEIQELYGNNHDGGLLAYYPFNGNVNDESGNENDGTSYGDLSYVEDRFGNQNQAIKLDGNDDKVTLPKLQIRFPWSISFWTGPLENTESYTFITDHWDAYWADYYGFRIVVDRDGKIRGGFGNGHGYGSQVTKTFKTKESVIEKNDWYHVVLTFEDYNNIKIYVDGKLIDAEQISNNSLSDISFQNERPEIGADDYDTGERYWKGKLDDIKIFESVLSSAKINDLYQEGDWSDENYNPITKFELNIDDDMGHSRTSYSLNQISVKFNIEASKNISDIEIKAELNNEPMKLYNLAHDLIENSKISYLESNETRTYNLISKEYTKNLKNANLSISIKTINGQSFDSTINETLTLYFAKNANEDNRAFSFDPDVYQFNPARMSLNELAYELGPKLTSPITLFYKDLLVWKGRCFGMAASIGAYFKYPDKKPLSGYPWDWGKGEENIPNPVMSNITTYHVNQFRYTKDFEEENSSIYSKIETDINNGNPVIIGLKDTKQDIGHAVLGLKVIRFEKHNTNKIYLYDSNNSYHVQVLLFKENNADFSRYPYVGETNYNKLCYVNQKAFSYTDLDILLNDYYGQVTELLNTINKKIFVAACPINMYAKNDNGKRFGYLEDGSFINEITDAEIIKIPTNNYKKDSITYIYAPDNHNYEIYMHSTDTGEARFEYYKPVDNETSYSATIDSIDLENQTLLQYNDTASTLIEVDQDGDGEVDKTLPLEEYPVVSSNVNILNQHNRLNIYPNPILESAIIEFPNKSSSKYELIVYDISGKIIRKVYDIRSSRFVFKREKLQSGIYLLELIGPKVFTGKIVIK